MEGSPQDATAQAPVPKTTVRTVLISTLTGTIVVGLALVLLAPPDVPRPRDSSVVEVVLASTTMIAVVRVLVLALGLALLVTVLYVGASAAARLMRREWLHRAGPFEAQVRDMDAIQSDQSTSALEAQLKNLHLSEVLDLRDREIARLKAVLANDPRYDPEGEGLDDPRR